MADENIFAFDPTPFMQGLKRVADGIGGLQKNAGNMTKSISSGVVSAVKKIGVLALAFKGVKAAISEMPEIGKTFEIAKNIITRNLLFPLRKAVFPLLQKFLNWVRDNRAMFVKWGQTLANIFGTVVNAVKGVISIGESLGRVFMDFINKTFGTEIKTFEELLNVLTFKIAVVIEFLKALAEPIFNIFSKVADLAGTVLMGAFESIVSFVEGFISTVGDFSGLVTDIVDSLKMIAEYLFTANEQGNSMQTVFTTIGEIFGKIVNFLGKIVKSFLEGFGPAIKNIMTPVQNLANAYKKIFDLLFGGTEQLGFWQDAFKFIGDVAGTVLVVVFEAIATAVELIAAGIEKVVEGIKWLSKNIGGVLDKVGGVFSGIGKFGGKALDFLNPFDDVIVTKDGKVVPVNPQDNIVAFKEGGPIAKGGSGNPVSVNVDFRGMQLLVQNATTEEASRFSETLVEQFRSTLTLELERAGVK